MVAGSRRRDAVVPIGALVLMAVMVVVVWIAHKIHNSDNPANTATVYNAYLNLATLLVSLLALLSQWWWKGRRAPAVPVSAVQVTAAADQPALSMLDTWRHEAEAKVLAERDRQLAQAAEAVVRADTAVAQLHQRHAAELAALGELQREHAAALANLQRQRDAAYESAAASEAERRQERQRRDAAERQAVAERAHRDQIAAERDDLRRQLDAERHQPPRLPMPDPVPVAADSPVSEVFPSPASGSAGPERAVQPGASPSRITAKTDAPRTDNAGRSNPTGCKWLTGAYGQPTGVGRFLRSLDRLLSTPEHRQRAARYEHDIRCCTDPDERVDLVILHAAAARGIRSRLHIHYTRIRGRIYPSSVCYCPLRWCLSCRPTPAQRRRVKRQALNHGTDGPPDRLASSSDYWIQLC